MELLLSNVTILRLLSIFTIRAICIPFVSEYYFACFTFFFFLLHFNFCSLLSRRMKWHCGQLTVKTGISGATSKTLSWQFMRENREGGEDREREGRFLARRLAGYLFTVWEDEVSIVGPRGSDERNVSPKRNRHLQIEYPSPAMPPFFSWCCPSTPPYRKIQPWHFSFSFSKL